MSSYLPFFNTLHPAYFCEYEGCTILFTFAGTHRKKTQLHKLGQIVPQLLYVNERCSMWISQEKRHAFNKWVKSFFNYFMQMSVDQLSSSQKRHALSKWGQIVLQLLYANERRSMVFIVLAQKKACLLKLGSNLSSTTLCKSRTLRFC